MFERQQPEDKKRGKETISITRNNSKVITAKSVAVPNMRGVGGVALGIFASKSFSVHKDLLTKVLIKDSDISSLLGASSTSNRPRVVSASSIEGCCRCLKV